MHKLGSAYADSRWKKLGNHPVLTPCYQGARDATLNFRPREDSPITYVGG